MSNSQADEAAKCFAELRGASRSLEEAIANSEPMPLKEIAMATPKSAVRMTSRFAMDAAMLGSPATRFTPRYS